MERIKEFVEGVQENIVGLAIISVIFIFFGIRQLGVAPTIRVISWDFVFAVIFLASGIFLWTQKSWGWVLALLASALIAGFGLYGVYVGIANGVSAVTSSGITYAIPGILFLLYLTRGNVRGKFV
ncbi:hypothetical protein AKJ61_02335 [candidate division MSBL1 archaeon SCGC-AAA259B11]|uniref:Uncharacterized protein n=1 Tax=candidate division MSBL1 archaeon SCGC-AAA259B11 TaxID=1698260 RepID=A0A133U6C0_9EURY|nr:hypothetical protein AKJ61_02335 [candidate division MSBL1 archaeon SCGC-AAA259B11]